MATDATAVATLHASAPPVAPDAGIHQKKVAAIALAAIRYHFVGRFLIGAAVSVAVGLAASRYWTRFARDRRRNRSTVAGLVACAMAQEISNLVEAYLVLAWLGAGPTIASVVVLEGISRLMNGAGQFIPGKLGVTEAATTALAEGLRLGGAHGLSLALARRARSLVWGVVGIAFIAYRAAIEQSPVGNDLQVVPVEGVVPVPSAELVA